MWSALCTVGFLPIVAITGQMILEQHPREVTLRVGDAVTFQCSMRGDDMSNYFMYWYRQGPGGSLKFIYREGDIYGEGFKEHFKGFTEGSRATLQIVAAKQGDAAMYYCGASITLEQLCSKEDQKPPDGEDRSLGILSKSSCTPGVLSGTGRCRKHPSGLGALEGRGGKYGRRTATTCGAGGSLLGTSEVVWASACSVQVDWAPVQHILTFPLCLGCRALG